MSVSWYMRILERMIIIVLTDLGIDKASRKENMPGVWIGDEKICALGVRLARWVTMHGFALNINPDMKYFASMIPCGIFEYGVTTLRKQGIAIDIKLLVKNFVSTFASILESENIEVSRI